MLLDCFKNFDWENLFKEKRLTFVKDLSLGQLDSAGRPITPSEGPSTDKAKDKVKKKKGSAEVDRVAALEKDVADLKARLERREKKEKKIKKVTKKRLEKGRAAVPTSPKLRKAAESLISDVEKIFKNPKALAEFVEDHPTYVTGDHRKWNMDFCRKFKDVLGLDEAKLKELKLLPHKNMAYVMAFQMILNGKEKLEKSFENPDKNKYTQLDGFMGAYTVSVSAAYLKREAAKQKKKPAYLAKLKFAELDLKEIKGNRDEFDEAKVYLNGLLGKPVVKAGGGGDVEAEGAGAAAEKVPTEIEAGELKNRKEALTKSITSSGALNLFTLKRSRESQREDFTWLRDEKERDPHVWWWINNFKDKPGSWPARAFSEYKEAYDKAEEEPTRENRARATELFDRLGDTVGDYYAQAEKIINQLKKKQGAKVAKLIDTYDLPIGIDITDLAPKKIIPMEREYEEVENPQYKIQKEEVLSRHLRDPKKIDTFYEDYFKKEFKPPKRTYKDWDELAPHLISPEGLEGYFSGVDTTNITNRVNEIIRLRNMYAVYNESKRLESKFEQELKGAFKKLNESYEEYYER